MTIVTIILPMLIVRGCNTVIEDVKEKGIAKKAEVKIKVYIKDQDKVEEMSLENYVKGVVAAEMPVNFEMEALKAQAVAARTFAFSRMIDLYPSKEDVHKGAHVCTDSKHCQAWVSKNDALKKWSVLNADKNWNKIVKAVKETEDIILLYEDNPINPLYHANSGGRTENSEEVWEGMVVPYLKSVKSDGDADDPNFEVVTAFKEEDIISALKSKYPEILLNEDDMLSQFNILELSEGGKVKKIKIGNVEIKGTELRNLLSLRSTNFKIEKGEENELNITTIGFGHGVGMSQYGANYLAKNGGTFKEILKHYYRGVSFDVCQKVDF